MKRLALLFIIGHLSMSVAVAQKRITREYQNQSISDALRQLADEQSDYTIYFLYNELEDFRITTSVHRKTVPDAIRQMIGFYPIRVSTTDDDDGRKIFVECIQKADTRYKGTIIDEAGQPIAYANVALLNPVDSILLNGGVSNESGYFAIPAPSNLSPNGAADPLLLKISFVGYKTVYKRCENPEIGTIQMQPAQYTIKGVQVKGHRLLYTSTEKGLQVAVQGTPLEQFGSVTEMLTHLPLMMSDGKIAGHGKPEIYINNKKVRDIQELDRYRADEILSAEIITNPGTEYGVNVTSVIRLKTVRKAGEGWSGNFSAAYRQGKENYANGNASLNYRTKNGMDFFARGYLTNQNVRIDATANDQLQASSIWDYQKEALCSTK